MAWGLFRMGSFNFSDIFRNSFLDKFSSDVSTTTICITLGFAFVVSVFVYFVYKLTSKNILYSKKFNATMCLISIVTAAVVLSMQSNIVVSLGMVGALSIIRFRTSIKEPRDLLFLFWSISNGIIIGAQVYEIAFILAIVLTIGMLFYDLLPQNKVPYLLIISINGTNDDEIKKLLDDKKVKYKIKSKNISNSKTSLIYEIRGKDQSIDISSISELDEVNEVNLLTQDGECQY